MSNKFPDGYAAIAETNGVGRNILEARLRAAAMELKTLHDNLIEVQERCTELLLEKRELSTALRLLDDLKALECSVSEPRCGNCVRCRARALIPTP